MINVINRAIILIIVIIVIIIINHGYHHTVGSHQVSRSNHKKVVISAPVSDFSTVCDLNPHTRPPQTSLVNLLPIRTTCVFYTPRRSKEKFKKIHWNHQKEKKNEEKNEEKNDRHFRSTRRQWRTAIVVASKPVL